MAIKTQINFEDFKAAWLEKEEITSDLNTLEKGRRFATKLLTEYYEIPEDYDNIFYLDGSGDGGIDIAYLERADDYEEEESAGDTWYLVQSKFGSSFQGFKTLLAETQKVFNTLLGITPNLKGDTKSLVDKIGNFRNNSTDKDRLVFIFATEDQITNEAGKQALKDIETLGKSKFGNIFEVKEVSIFSIYEKAENKPQIDSYIKATLRAKLINPNPEDGNVLAGAVRLTDLYDFLRHYRKQANGDLDKLYDKNIRKFLGNRGKINQKIKETLTNTPENFGLYNNGITIIVRNWVRDQNEKESYILHDPNIVNGCQTVTTIWDVLDSQDNSGGTKAKTWREKFNKAVVLVKIAKVFDNDDLIENITRYTNSQNAIKDKDFIALNSDFVKFKKELADKHKVFLEVHRGAWAVQLAIQNKNRSVKPFFEKTQWANVFDLIKVYGAGWFGRAGEALNNNSLFAPNGTIFIEIMNQEGFGSDDLLAAFHLLKKVEIRENKSKLRATATKFLFYKIVIELLKPIIASTKRDHQNNFIITQSILRLIDDKTAFDALTNQAISLLESYLSSADENSYEKEPNMEKFKDFSSFIKNAKILRDQNYSPILYKMLELRKYFMKEKGENSISKFDLIKDVLDKAYIPDNPINSAFSYVQTVEELKHLSLNNQKLTWKDICVYLDIQIVRQSGRELLKKWVKKNKPDWTPVP